MKYTYKIWTSPNGWGGTHTADTLDDVPDRVRTAIVLLDACDTGRLPGVGFVLNGPLHKCYYIGYPR